MIAPGFQRFYRAVALLVVLPALAQFCAGQENQAKPAEVANPKDGAVIFKQDCAVCHGAGPAANDLKVRPPNLATLARRHGGEFPNGYVLDVLRNGVEAPSHGTAEMPIWGPMFDTMNHNNATQSKLRIINLVNYLKSIQEK
jgi:mono/diheme cytochrome c family protein